MTGMLVCTQSLAIDGKTAGQEAGQSALTRFGSKDAVNSSISLPMTDSAYQMQTVNGATSFSATLNAPSSAKFLEVLIQPSGSGDLQKVIVSQDLNTDGSIDNLYTVPALVSGVCANGFISCSAGSWSNCSYYTWAATVDGRVTEAPASINDLGGCYCINSSCGSNLVWVNSAIVLKDIGGGIVNTVHNSNPSLTITNVTTDITTISYYGQLTTQTANAASSVSAFASSPTVSTLTGYYDNFTQLTSARDSAALSQASDPGSFYYLLSNSGAAREAQGKSSNCTIIRNELAHTDSEDIGFDLRFYTGYDSNGASKECFWAKDTMACMDIWFSGGQGWPTCKTTSLANVGKIVEQTVPGLVPTGFSCARVDVINVVDPVSPHPGCYGSSDNSTHAFYNVNCFSKLPQAGSQLVIESPIIREKRDSFTESITDGCSALAADPDCTLQSEKIDDVVTYQNSNPTGLNQLPSCRQITGQVGVTSICRDWWQKQRTYICGSQLYDFSDVATRFGQVVSSASDNTTDLTFQDPRLGPQGWSIASGRITLPERDPAAECEIACKTRIAKTDTQVTTTGTVTDMRVPASSYDIFYKTCVKNVCPVDPGEEVVLDCQCINEFAEAATVIQTLRLAGKDLICSSDQKQPLQSR
jgi:hypothetical protein